MGGLQVKKNYENENRNKYNNTIISFTGLPGVLEFYENSN